MSSEFKKIIIISTCLVVVITLLVITLVMDIDLKVINLTSINSLLAKHDEILKEEEKLKNKQTEYDTAVKKVETSKTSFDTEKAKYEAISDETINIIKEATTEENYDIEYMWITLGNYAKSNNLTIVMAEPGGDFSNTSANKDGSESTDTTTSNTDQTTTGNTNNTTTTNTVQQNTANSYNPSSGTVFKIQVTGSYLDVSDFIFEVENDKSLRFKLDNISMDYVSGNTIKASFNVKNLVINK